MGRKSVSFVVGLIALLCVVSGEANQRDVRAGDSHRLTVVTTGVCALAKDGSIWSLFMPKGAETHPAVTAGHAIPAHRPFLMLAVEPSDDFFPTAARQPDLYFETKGDQRYRRQAVFFLDNQSLTLKNAIHPPSPSTTPPASGEDGEIVSFGEVCCRAAMEKPVKDWDYLAAFLRLGESDLRPRKGTDKLWYFKSIKENCPKAVGAGHQGSKRMAREVHLQFQVPATGFSLVSEPGDKKLPAQGTIEFQKLTKDLKIEIGNAPVEDILQVGLPHDEKVDAHFELLYELMSRDKTGRPHPVPLHLPYRDDTAAVRPATSAKLRPSGSNCPPVTWP